MSRDDELLQQHAVRQARLVSALLHGRRRSWAQRRGVAASVAGGLVLALGISFGAGVTVVIRDQLAQTRAEQKRQEQQQQQLQQQQSPTPPSTSTRR